MSSCSNRGLRFGLEVTTLKLSANAIALNATA